MKKSSYIRNANNSNTEVILIQDYDQIGVSSVSRIASLYGLFAKLKRRVRSLFVHTAKLVRLMRTTNKQATKAKNSNLYAPIFKCQAIYFGWLTISRTFKHKADAVAWYERHQQGWRYRHAVAVIWQGCTRKTPDNFLCDALLGGDEWKLAKCHKIRSQADCEYILYSDDYEKICEYECAGR